MGTIFKCSKIYITSPTSSWWYLSSLGSCPKFETPQPSLINNNKTSRGINVELFGIINFVLCLDDFSREVDEMWNGTHAIVLKRSILHVEKLFFVWRTSFISRPWASIFRIVSWILVNCHYVHIGRLKKISNNVFDAIYQSSFLTLNLFYL